MPQEAQHILKNSSAQQLQMKFNQLKGRSVDFWLLCVVQGRYRNLQGHPLQGILILLIKVYPNGRMSSYLGKMSTGENILVSNPVATVDPADYPEAGDGASCLGITSSTK